MTRISIIICARYKDCGGGKCFRALKERVGAFSIYPAGELVEIVGYSSCGGCPGGNVEYVPAEFKKNGASVVHLATGLVVGYPPCPHIRRFKAYIEAAYDLPVVVGTHPIPQKYMDIHEKLPFWQESNMAALAKTLLAEPVEIKMAYN
ncbi:MAG: CGGC domain-containing protein [Candidatus Aminicenantes bacterium]|nr:CGGC domain-containing protein [Candidatus Aminicenantes bacterium]